jgi:uncharacterized protein involved in exopolysaccharide biosynthesis
LNPRLGHQEGVKNEDAVANGNYSLIEANGTSVEVAERDSYTGSDLLLTVWRERRFIAKAFAVGFLVAAIVSLLIPPTYESTSRLMPPERQSLSSLAGLLAAATSDDKTGSVVGGVMSDVLGMKTPGALYVGVLKSRTIQDALVDGFDLRNAYHTRLRKSARERLADSTDIVEDRKSGIISITVTDRSPRRAMELARAYPETLNNLTAQLDTSAAHRERVFIEDRLKTVKEELDAAAKNLSEFSSKNMTLDVKEQGKAMVESAAALEGELIAAQSQLSGLEQIYTANNVRVRSLKARVDELKKQLSSLKGVNPTTGVSEPDVPGEFGVSITKLPLLGVTYYDLYRRVKIEETVFEVLTKQYELAKINEAKELPTIKVLDQAMVPETKTSPKRTLITLAGALLAALLATLYVIVSLRIRVLSMTRPSFGLLGLEMRDGMGADLKWVRTEVPQFLRKARARLRPHSDAKEKNHPDVDAA